MEAEAPPLKRRDYPAPDKVSFGFLASAHAFSIAGLAELVRELGRRVGESFAPQELVIGGRVGERVKSPLHMRKLGFVPNEAGFYAQVDCAIAPVFDGTGFKIKPVVPLQFAAERPVLRRSGALIMRDNERMRAPDTATTIRATSPFHGIQHRFSKLRTIMILLNRAAWLSAHRTSHPRIEWGGCRERCQCWFAEAAPRSCAVSPHL